MQGKEFKADMRLIPLGGCDKVLGIQWLALLGPQLRGNLVGMEKNGAKQNYGKKIVSALQMEKDISYAPIVATAQIFSMQLEATYVMNKETIIEEMLDGLQKLLIKY